MVDVTTPDGRTLTLPRSLAAMSQQIAPAAPVGAGMPEIPGGFTAPTFGDAPYTPERQAPLPALPAGVVEMGDPEVTPVTMMPEMDVKARPAVMKKLAKQEAARAASPEGKLAVAQGQQTAATNAEAEAIASAADIEAAEQAVAADAYTERNQQIDKLFADRQVEAQRNAQAEDAKLNEVVSLRKKISGTKIDRSADHPIIAALAIALAGFGSALKGESGNPALEAFNKAIERKVAAQESDLDLMGKVYGMTKEELDLLKSKSKSRLEFHNAMIAGETEKAVRHLEELTARSASDKTKANAKIFIAQLQARAADKTMEATRWGLDFDQKDKHQKAQIGLGYANLKETKRSNMADEQFKREQLYADLQKALAGDKARGDEAMFKARMEASKEVRQTGLKGVDNDYLLTPEGRAKVEAAAKLELEAQQTEELHKNDPMGSSIKATRVQALRQRAAELRGDAYSFNVVQARDPNQASALSTRYAAAQTMMDTIDEIKILYDQEGRGLISKTKLQQELQAKYGLISVAAKDAWELGAWDKGSAALVGTIIGKDPTNMDVGYVTSNIGVLIGNDPEGFKNRLDAVAVSLEQNVRQRLAKNSTWDGKGELFTRKKAMDMNAPVGKAVSDLTQKRSGVEIEKRAEGVGTVGKTARAVGYPLSPSHAEEADAAQSVKYPGLSKEQEAPYEALLAEYKAGNTKAGDQLVAEVVNIAKKRPDLAIALIHNMEEHAQSLAVAAKSALPKDSEAEKQVSFEANTKISRTPVPPAELATIVINTMDSDGRVTADAEYRALARRAGEGDPAAKQAIADIVGAMNNKKSNRAQPWDTRPKPKLAPPAGRGGRLGPILPNKGR